MSTDELADSKFLYMLLCWKFSNFSSKVFQGGALVERLKNWLFGNYSSLTSVQPKQAISGQYFFPSNFGIFLISGLVMKNRFFLLISLISWDAKDEKFPIFVSVKSSFPNFRNSGRTHSVFDRNRVKFKFCSWEHFLRADKGERWKFVSARLSSVSDFSMFAKWSLVRYSIAVKFRYNFERTGVDQKTKEIL